MRIIKSILLFAVIPIVLPVGAQQAIGKQQPDSLDIKIGQMILIGFAGKEVDRAVLQEIQQGKVGSIIIFEKNIPSPSSYLELKRIIWTYQKASPIPLFIAIDQEGGRVNRLKEKYSFPPTLSAEDLGKLSDDTVRMYSQMTAATLAGLGVNVNFAPVVDLASNPSNPVIAKLERAFSSDPDAVARLARIFIEEHLKFGVINVLKHFPGHGSSKADTHLGLVDVTTTWNETELKPYKTLIDSGVAQSVMTAHIVNKNLDEKGYPGTLSTDIIDGILRRRLGFDGVVFSDDMQMLAIAEHYGLEEAIRLSINAGVDILTFSNNIQASQLRTVDKVHEIIRNFVEQGVISQQRINESYKRIIKLKKTLDQNATDELFDAARSIREKDDTIEALRNELRQKDQLINQLETEGKKKKKKRQ